MEWVHFDRDLRGEGGREGGRRKRVVLTVAFLMTFFLIPSTNMFGQRAERMER